MNCSPSQPATIARLSRGAPKAHFDSQFGRLSFIALSPIHSLHPSRPTTSRSHLSTFHATPASERRRSLLTMSTDASRRASADKIRSTISSFIPDIPYLTFSAFQSLPPPLLIDVRSPSEIASGTLPGSVTPSEAHEVLSEQPAARPVVAFCTVGLRSGAFARGLEAGEGRQVHNYSVMEHIWGGGVLERPDGRPWEGVVHTYTHRYGELFPEGLQKETYVGWSVVKNLLPAIPWLVSAGGAWAWRGLFSGTKNPGADCGEEGE